MDDCIYSPQEVFNSELIWRTKSDFGSVILDEKEFKTIICIKKKFWSDDDRVEIKRSVDILVH